MKERRPPIAMDILGEALELKESLIVPSMGYLKVPERFKNLFGGVSPKHYPNPRASMIEDKESDEVHLIFSFNLREISKLRKGGKKHGK